jgi:hypothetical protein
MRRRYETSTFALTFSIDSKGDIQKLLFFHLDIFLLTPAQPFIVIKIGIESSRKVETGNKYSPVVSVRHRKKLRDENFEIFTPIFSILDRVLMA